MNNKEFYKDIMSGVQPSEQTIERIMDMTKKENKKRIKFAPVVAFAACLAILVTAVVGGSAITAKINQISDNSFVLTAYAKGNDDSEIVYNLNENDSFKTDLKLELVQGDNGDYNTVVCDSNAGFRIDGKNIKSATYCAQRGSFNYQSLIGNDFAEPVVDFGYIKSMPYSTKITFDNIGNKECLELFYSPEEAVSCLIEQNISNPDYSLLKDDVITITVEYNDGSKAEQTVNVSFSKDGFMTLELNEIVSYPKLSK